MQEGVLIRPHIQIDFMRSANIIGADIAIKAHFAAFEQLEREDPGKWALSQGSRDQYLKQNTIAKNSGLMVELVQAIPVPLKDTPIETILDFKEKRRPELLRLRGAINETHARIVSADDQQDAVIKASEEIERSCLDLIKTVRERWKIFRLTDFQTIFTATSVPAIAEAVVYSHMPTVSAAVGGASAVLKVARDVGLRKKAARENPFWYIAKFHKEILG